MGVLDGTRLLSPKTIELMTTNHLPGGKELPDLSVSLFSEASYSGVGFGLGFAVTTNPARTLILRQPGRLLLGRHGEHRISGSTRARQLIVDLHDPADSVDTSITCVESCARWCTSAFTLPAGCGMMRPSRQRRATHATPSDFRHAGLGNDFNRPVLHDRRELRGRE